MISIEAQQDDPSLDMAPPRCSTSVAHRLSTVERPDRILVLERGRLVEAGKYRELIDADGPFNQLAWRQIL